MILLIPLGPDAEVPRFPPVTAVLLGLNLLAFLVTSPYDAPRVAEEETRLERVAEWTLTKAALDAPGLAEARRRHPSALAYLAAEDGWRAEVRHDEERGRLERVLADHRALIAGHPFYRFGFVPADITPLRLVAHQFLHFDLLHLVFNGIFLWAVGGLLELTWGKARFLAFYLCGGVAAALAHAASAPRSTDPAVGASGAVAALMGAFAAVHGRQPMRLALVSMLAIAPRISFISLPALVFLGLWLLEQVFWTVISRYMPLAVAFWAHLGGFGFGAVAAFLLKDRLAAGGAA